MNLMTQVILIIFFWFVPNITKNGYVNQFVMVDLSLR